jgi:two-component system, chemotaxis family, CheB/CheR fusion protein
MARELSLQELIDRISRQRGFDLRGYKLGTLERRLRKRMNALSLPSFHEYLEKFESDPAEANELLNIVLINVTEFFRDPSAWEFIRVNVLPDLLKTNGAGRSFRAWSAGCSSGEEAYSLAIIVANHLGDHVSDFDVKIYATDIDDNALNLARRGEYSADHLKRVPQEWRNQYFHSSGSLFRVNRDLRRMVIFGRSSLVHDAPISHCDLVACRNVLIYLDPPAQKLVFGRLRYALEPNGVLFLGKAESKLSQSDVFRPLNPRWRIFQKVSNMGPKYRFDRFAEGAVMPDDTELNSKAHQELRMLKLYQKSILDTFKSGLIILDNEFTVVVSNDAVPRIWRLTGSKLTGKSLQNTELIFRCPELVQRIDELKEPGKTEVRFECRPKSDGEDRVVEVVARPIIEEGERNGTIIYCEDASDHEKLQGTIEQLEATGEELQSANEELETTNEELQSTNEELETTNEELQSTNEELETTNEELHSLNEELENMNDELERRSRELNELTARYAETLQRMPWPVMLVDSEMRIQLWNAAAQRLFGVGATSVVGVDLDQLPLQEVLRKAIVRRCEAVAQSKKPSILRGQEFMTDHLPGSMDLHFTPITGTQLELEGVLIMFGPFVPVELPKKQGRAEGNGRAKNGTSSGASNNTVKKAVKKSGLKKKSR